MKLIHKYMGLLALCLFSVACGPRDPGKSFNYFSEALEQGKTETFLNGLTTESRVLVEGILSLNDRFPRVLKAGPFSKSAKAVNFEIVDQRAVVLVQCDQERAVVSMRFQDGQWRIDLVATEWEWNRDWSLSGAPVLKEPADLYDSVLDEIGKAPIP